MPCQIIRVIANHLPHIRQWLSLSTLKSNFGAYSL